MEHEDKIILYMTDSGKVTVLVRFEGENFWMTQKAIAELFDTERSVITKHLSNIYEEEELDRNSTYAKFAQVQIEGNREVSRLVDFFNLDAIIAVGYRVNSKKATRFRQWATKTLHEYIRKGFVLNDELLKNGKGTISHEAAVKKAEDIYEQFRVRQDKDYISQFDKEMAKYLKGEADKDE